MKTISFMNNNSLKGRLFFVAILIQSRLDYILAMRDFFWLNLGILESWCLLRFKVLYKVRHYEVREHIVKTSTKDQTVLK